MLHLCFAKAWWLFGVLLSENFKKNETLVCRSLSISLCGLLAEQGVDIFEVWQGEPHEVPGALSHHLATCSS